MIFLAQTFIEVLIGRILTGVGVGLVASNMSEPFQAAWLTYRC